MDDGIDYREQQDIVYDVYVGKAIARSGILWGNEMQLVCHNHIEFHEYEIDHNANESAIG